jgi:hypothetical protein
MNLRSIPRFAVDAYLKTVKKPLDLVAGRIGDRDTGATGAEVAVDRADAGARAVAGSVLGDEQLAEDAARRRTAAEDRADARRLRNTADEHGERADASLDRREEQAEEARSSAAKGAERRTRSAAQQREARQKRATQAEKTRKQAAQRTREREQERVEAQERRERLDALDAKSEALEERDEALTAADEAQRLADAAAEIKSARKSS